MIDDGRGFVPDLRPHPEPGHLGLSTMVERAELAGGWARVISAPGRGDDRRVLAAGRHRRRAIRISRAWRPRPSRRLGSGRRERRVDREARSPGRSSGTATGPSVRRIVDPGVEVVRASTRAQNTQRRLVLGHQQDLFVLLVGRRADLLGRDRRRVDAEDHVDLRAELLGDVGRHLDRRAGPRRATATASSMSEGRIPRITVRPSKAASDARLRSGCRTPRSATRSPGHRRLHEVHRRGADEGGDEQVGRMPVEVLRRVDLLQDAVAHAPRRDRPSVIASTWSCVT